MKKILLLLTAVFAGSALCVSAQEALEVSSQEPQQEAPKAITLEQALQIAMSENASVKVEDLEIKRSGYAKRGAYASLYPQIDGSASFQRTIRKQVMYMDMDFDIPGAGGDQTGDGSTDAGSASPFGDGMEVGRWNTWSAGVNASMPLVNAQLWKSIRLSKQDVELAVEKARGSRLEMVNQVKQAYFSCLLAKEAFSVYKSVYENALENYKLTQNKFNAQKASELDLTRSKTTLANSIPNVYDAESSVILALWQLKAVMGVELDENIDVVGALPEYADHFLYDYRECEELSLENNTTLRQLGLQAEQLATTIKMQRAANIPSLALSFAFMENAMTNDFKFSQFKWSPYSYVGLSLQIPIFAGGKRYNAIKQTRTQATELSIQTQDTERKLRIAIRQYLNQMETAMKSHSAAESALETAQKAYDIVAKSFEVGRSTQTDLNDAQLSLTQAQLGANQAVYNFLVAKANLENTLGADFVDADGNVQLNKTYNNE